MDYNQHYHSLAQQFLESYKPIIAARARKSGALNVRDSSKLGIGTGYISAHFRTEKWPFAAAASSACWAQIGRALALALRERRLTTVFIGTDLGRGKAIKSVSYGSSSMQQRSAETHLREQVLVPLKSQGYDVILGANCGSTTIPRSSVECATVDQILMASSELFLHMYGEELSACPGAKAGSCYGKWILANRRWRGRETAALASKLRLD